MWWEHMLIIFGTSVLNSQSLGFTSYGNSVLWEKINPTDVHCITYVCVKLCIPHHPDFNSIAMVWSSLKYHVSKYNVNLISVMFKNWDWNSFREYLVKIENKQMKMEQLIDESIDFIIINLIEELQSSFLLHYN